MNLRGVHLFLMVSLLGIIFPANAIVPLPIIEEFEGPHGENILRISISERYVKDITDQDKYEKNLSGNIQDRSYWTHSEESIGLMLTRSIIIFSELGLSYEIPATLEKFREKFTLHRGSNSVENHALAKIADVVLSNVVARLTHQEEKLNLFTQTRDVLEQEKDSTNPFIKWMACRVLARTADDEGKTDQAINLLKEVSDVLPVEYKDNVGTMLHILEAKFNIS